MGCGALWLMHPSASQLIKHMSLFAHKAYYIQLCMNSSREWALSVFSVKLGSKPSSCPWGGAHSRLSFDYVVPQHHKGPLVGFTWASSELNWEEGL